MQSYITLHNLLKNHCIMGQMLNDFQVVRLTSWTPPRFNVIVHYSTVKKLKLQTAFIIYNISDCYLSLRRRRWKER